jgi:hypothetical protein
MDHRTLQLIIRTIFEQASKQISIEGTKVMAVPLFDVLDANDPGTLHRLGCCDTILLLAATSFLSPSLPMHMMQCLLPLLSYINRACLQMTTFNGLSLAYKVAKRWLMPSFN